MKDDGDEQGGAERRGVHHEFALAWLRRALAELGEVEVDATLWTPAESVTVVEPRLAHNDAARPAEDDPSLDLHARQATSVLSAAFGGTDRVVVRHEIEPMPLHIDLRAKPARRSRRGLLGRLTSTATSWEILGRAPTKGDVQACLLKQLNVLSEADAPPEREPMFWMLSPTANVGHLKALGLRRERASEPGVYRAAPFFRLGLVVIDKLPVRRATLALRLLGTGATLKRALTEVAALSSRAWERRVTRGALEEVCPKGNVVPLEPVAMSALRRLYARWGCG